jgi:DNA primase
MASIIEALMHKIDIVDLINDSGVELRQSSRGYTGHCILPDHIHDSGSESQTLWVTTDPQMFHCFSCGESGNAISWYAKLNNLAFYEALNKLCEISNIDLSNNKDYQEERNLVKGFTEQAAKLHGNSSLCSDYLINQRGLTQESIDLHKIGYDEYKEAISIPLIDHYSRIVGMAFRNQTRMPKYINSKNNDLYDKSSYLYNLVNARKLIKKTGRLWCVEGYMDSISGQSQGEAVVAWCSAAMNKGHILEIKNTLRDHKNIEVIIASDNDEAGQSKIAKMAEKFRKFYPKANLRVALYPEGCKDMNDVLVAGLNIADIETMAVDMFILQQLLGKCKSPEEKYSVVQEFAPTVPNPLVLADIAEYLVTALNKPLEKIEAMLSIKANSKDEKLKKLASFDESFADFKESVMGEMKGIGFAQMDYAMNGTKPSECLVISGYTGSGKSTIALKIIASRIIRYKENVVYFSLEMSKGMVLQGIIMEVLEVNQYELEKLIKTDAGIEIYSKVKGIVDKHLRIVDDPNTTVEEMKEYINLCNSDIFDSPVNTFCLDHYHLLDGAEDNAIAVTLANKIGCVIKECNVNAVILAQMNEGSQSNVKLGKFTECTLSDVKGSNALKAIAHTILLVWRMLYCYPQKSEIEKKDFQYITRVKIGKHRRGLRGDQMYFDLQYDPTTTKMTENKTLYQMP